MRARAHDAEDVRTLQWRDASRTGLEHLRLRMTTAGVVAEAAVIVGAPEPFACRYRVRCEEDWSFRHLTVELVGGKNWIDLTRKDRGLWRRDGAPCSQLLDAIDIDLSISPFTNTLPIRRLRLGVGQSAEIVTAYVSFPDLDVTPDPQRYTRLDQTTYRYESLGGSFVRDITVDADGLVVDYPGLFTRVP